MDWVWLDHTFQHLHTYLLLLLHVAFGLSCDSVPEKYIKFNIFQQKILMKVWKVYLIILRPWPRKIILRRKLPIRWRKMAVVHIFRLCVAKWWLWKFFKTQLSVEMHHQGCIVARNLGWWSIQTFWNYFVFNVGVVMFISISLRAPRRMNSTQRCVRIG